MAERATVGLRTRSFRPNPTSSSAGLALKYVGILDGVVGHYTSMLLVLIWRLWGNGHPLDILVLWGFVVSPLVYDYDLLQIIPILTLPVLEWVAILLSVPMWWTIISQYSNDAAWVTFTILAPGLLAVYIFKNNSEFRQRLSGLLTQKSV